MRRVSHRPGAAYDPGAWPYSLAPVAQLLRDGLALAPGVTFLVGENGSGKSTLVEAVAMAYGMGPEGGSAIGDVHGTRASESPLHEVLELERSPSSGRWSYFLRAETAHGLYTYLEGNRPDGSREPSFHELSHGESFLALLGDRMDSAGFYCLDEPESALSFSSCLALVGMLADLARGGAQVLCATHSPLLTALPGAAILELDEDGYAATDWESLAVVEHWRAYLADPRRYLRHLLD